MYISDEASTPADLRKAKNEYIQPMHVGEGLVGTYDSFTPSKKMNNLVMPEHSSPAQDAGTDSSARIMGLHPVMESGSPGKTTVKDSIIG